MALVVRVVITDPPGARDGQLVGEEQDFIVLRSVLPPAIAQWNEFANEVLSANDTECARKVM